jgi:hypothetical protein
LPVEDRLPPSLHVPAHPGEESASATVTRRALVIGMAMAAWVTLWPSYTSLILRSTRADYAHLSVALLIPFVCLLAFNILLERRGYGLSPSELLIICCIGMVAAFMQGEWLSNYLITVLAVPHYFASPENRWDDLILPHMPDWAVVADRQSAAGLFEGLSPGHLFPWAAWVRPLFWWGTFLAAVLSVSLCLNVILRKQWTEHERLAYPIARALFEITGVAGSRGTLETLCRSRLFQVGFASIFLIICWNITTWFFVAMPQAPILNAYEGLREITIARGFPPAILTLSPLTLIFGYFTNLEVLFSIWFFYVLTMIQAGVFNRIGMDLGSSDPWCSFHPAIGWQGFGGMIVFVGWGLWIARHHLRDVFSKAFRRDGGVDDSEELMSYRTTVWFLIGSLVYSAFWLHGMGMGWGPILAFWFATLVLYLGLARILVESGLVFLRGPITAQAFTWHLFGVLGMGPASAVALGLTFSYFCDAKTLAMTPMSHVPRLGMAMNRASRKVLAPAVTVGALVGAVSVIGFTLYQGYFVTGSYNFGSDSFGATGGIPAVTVWRLTAGRIQGGFMSTDWTRIFFLGVGSAFTGLLYYLRYRFPGFPIHPIGFTISASSTLRNTTMTIFLVWLIKSLILRIGGLEKYRATAPLFLGMLMGFLAGVALGVIVDAIWFPGNGHEIHVAW